MTLIDIDSLEYARHSIIEVEVDLGIQIIEDTSSNPNNNQNGGYQKVKLILNDGASSRQIATIIFHHQELEDLITELNI